MPNQTIGYFIHWVLNSNRLNSKEEDVLVDRLKRNELKKIGKKYKVSYERIRQIEKGALEKLSSKIFQEKLFNN